MDIFEFRDRLISDCARSSRGFVRIAADDLQELVEREYDRQRHWPVPLIHLNTNCRFARSVQELARDGALHFGCADVFRVGKDPVAPGSGVDLRLYQHQEQPIALAHQRRSFVVSAGTGSGNTLTFFIPTIDRVLKARPTEPLRRTRAIGRQETRRRFLCCAGRIATAQRDSKGRDRTLARPPRRAPIKERVDG